MSKTLFKILGSSLLGAFFLTPLIALQASLGLVEFSRPVFFQIDWWVPLLLAWVSVLMTFTFPWLEEFLTATFTFKHRFIFAEFFAIAAAFIGISVTQAYPYLMVFILSIYVLFRLGFFHAKWDWLFFLMGALIFPTFEMMLISMGLYHFSDADFLGIPYWLPLEWGVVSLATRRISHVIEAWSMR